MIMENLNLVELLRDCPTGMELDCTMYDNLEFDHIDVKSQYPVKCRAKITDVGYNSHEFTEYGRPNFHSNAKCVIFPKGKTTWEGFVPPLFKNGDIVTLSNACGIHTFIYNNTIDGRSYGYYAIITSMDNFKVGGFCSGSKYRLATEEEKQKLFDAIKANGCKWNPETKTLEKLPKFKVGDRIRHKTTNKDDVYEISKVYDDSYGLVGFTWMIYMKYQDQYELVPNKFDINTLVPFESKVLVRAANYNLWKPALFGFVNSGAFYIVGGNTYRQCIPYEANKELLGTTNDCDEYYKTWEK